jgi:D-serine deaminase-like pyridoxal phosphate-dependent protein
MQEADAALRKLGLAGLRGGSTPTAALVIQGALNEMRPGVYAFNDAQQVELGAADWDAVALTAAATVVSRHGRDIVLDAGSKSAGS